MLFLSAEAVSQRRGGDKSLSDKDRGTLLLPGDSLSGNRRHIAPPVQDSIASDTLANDSVEVEKKDGLDAPVSYEANDSIVFTQEGYAHLYGDGKVTYPSQNIELTAEVITMNMDSSTVYAHGVEDSIGVMQGTPVFKDGSTPYETNTIRYNFKSKKGIISNVVSQQGEGYVTGNNAKKGSGDELYMKKGRYTT